MLTPLGSLFVILSIVFVCVFIHWLFVVSVYIFFAFYCNTRCMNVVKEKGVSKGWSGAIFGHLRRSLADGEQSVALRPIRTKPVSTARCVPPKPQRAVSTIKGAWYQAN